MVAGMWLKGKPDFGRAMAPPSARVEFFLRCRWRFPAPRLQRGAAMTTTTIPTVRAPHGTQLSCKGWQQEAALRSLRNNLDPEVAERPSDLVVYGGPVRTVRNWECFH